MCGAPGGQSARGADGDSGGFTGTVGAEQAVDSTCGYIEIDAGDRGDGGLAGINFLERAEADNALGLGHNSLMLQERQVSVVSLVEVLRTHDLYRCIAGLGGFLGIDLGIVGDAVARGEDDAVALLQAADYFSRRAEVTAKNEVA